MTGKNLLERLNSPEAEGIFSMLYGEEGPKTARQRYRRLIEELSEDIIFPEKDFHETRGELCLFSVPGRTELGGNHTDHNHGKVLAASIQLDAAAAVAPRQDKQVFFRSVGHRDVKVDLTDLSYREDEKGNTEALIRGIAAEFAAQGTPVRGFTANADNMVLTGSGLSSSAVVEVLFAKIFDNLYCGGKRSALELAKIAQKAENVYFGKPCGLMDQIACASGGAAAIDFQNSQNPEIKKINFDPVAAGYVLCVVNTRGRHSDLTPDYAAIPGEMKAVAAFFNKPVLRDLDEEIFMSRLPDLRKAVGGRAVLRAFHFYGENRRVDAMLAVLEDLNALPGRKLGAVEPQPKIQAQEKAQAMETFLALVRESGDSSSELLQNIYPMKDPAEQGLGMALALTKNFLKSDSGDCRGNCRGACRVHGGGFAGTIQAYLPIERLGEYRTLIEEIFGEGALTVLRIRPMGAVELEF